MIRNIREMRASGIPDGPAADHAPNRILLLEDIAFFRHLIKGYLKEKGYEVVDCKNGKLGLEQLEENDFDLIVSDLEMPVMNGWKFIKNVRQTLRKKDIPAVALTSLDTEEARQRTLESGFDYFEVKLDREHFLQTISTALRKNP